MLPPVDVFACAVCVVFTKGVAVGAETVVVLTVGAGGAACCVINTYATAAMIIIATTTIAAITPLFIPLFFVPLFIVSHYGADGGLEPGVQSIRHGEFA